MLQFGTLKKTPLIDTVAATSVGIIAPAPMLDLCYQEDSQAEVDMNVVMTGAGKFIEVQATAEKTAFDDAQLATLLGLARHGIQELTEIQKTRRIGMTVYCATSNPGKLREFQLAAPDFDIQKLPKQVPAPDETAGTFEEKRNVEGPFTTENSRTASSSPTTRVWRSTR